MKKISKKKLIILIVALITIVGLGSLYAYLTSTDHKTNIFTVGSVKITLTEPNWNPSNAIDFLPGDTITKDPKINNVGKNAAYVYIKVINPIVELSNGEGPLFSYTTNTGWTQLDQVDQCGYRSSTYYYNTALNPNASTTTLFNNVTINNFSGEVGEEKSLDLYGFAVQSSYLESGSTIQSIFTTAFANSLSDLNVSCRSATDCSNNTVYTTVPTKLQGLAKIMAQDAYLDNAESEYVNSCNGVSFNDVSSDTNGKGIYEIASTKYDTYPIYYYRGAVDNNNVKFAGFCWKAIRTTDTGGVKLIYNGLSDQDGYCTNTTGESTQIGTSKFNSNYSPTYVGYMYGSIYQYSNISGTELNNVYVYGNDVSYSDGTYTLQNTKTSSGRWQIDYTTLNNNRYTCFSDSNTCNSLYYIYDIDSFSSKYITLTGGKKVEDALDDMLVNITNSTAKTQIDNWYSSNLSNYTSFIEDTIYCNDRSIGSLGGWDNNAGDNEERLKFEPRVRTMTNYSPNLLCSRAQDRFTVSSTRGNGALTYPVGLLTSDEVMYAGGCNRIANTTYYLFTNQHYWTMSPSHFYYAQSEEYSISNDTSYWSIASNRVDTNDYGLRPVISLKSTDVVESGDGTSTNPYFIKTN